MKAVVLWIDGECLYARSAEYGDFMLNTKDYPGAKKGDNIEVRKEDY